MSHKKAGNYIELKDGRFGVVKFYGRTNFEKGNWIGIELLNAKGSNDGTLYGKKYFETKKNRGLFVREELVEASFTKTPGQNALDIGRRFFTHSTHCRLDEVKIPKKVLHDMLLMFSYLETAFDIDIPHGLLKLMLDYMGMPSVLSSYFINSPTHCFSLAFRGGGFTFRVIKRVDQVYSCDGAYQMCVKKGHVQLEANPDDEDNGLRKWDRFSRMLAGFLNMGFVEGSILTLDINKMQNYQAFE